MIQGPRILTSGIQSGSAEVESNRFRFRSEDLRFETGKEPEGLSISLKASDASGPLVECLFAVVTEWRVTEIVRKAGHVNQIGADAEVASHLSTNLSDFERMRETSPSKIPSGRL